MVTVSITVLDEIDTPYTEVDSVEIFEPDPEIHDNYDDDYLVLRVDFREFVVLKKDLLKAISIFESY